VIATSLLERMQMPGAAGTISIDLELSPDPRVFLVALLVSLATGLIFGLAPALQAARTDIATRLRSESAASGRRTAMSSILVVGQLALSLVLLVAAGLFVRALDRGARVDPGFDVRGVAVASLNADAWGYDEARSRAFFRTLRDRLEGTAGISALSYAVRLPLTMHTSSEPIVLDGTATNIASGAEGTTIHRATVDANYFDVLRIPIVRGQAFGRIHDERAAKVAVVNETFGRRFWPEGSALGRTFDYRGERVTIIGMARDAKYADLSETTPPFVYFPVAQFWDPEQILVARTAGDPLRVTVAIQAAIRSIDPTLPRVAVTTLEQEIAIVLLPQRVAAIVTGALGVLGLLLASVGLYGIIAYSTSRRTREIGVRIAVGARSSDVLGLIVRQGMRLAVIGVAMGVVLSAVVSRFIAKFLLGVSPLDIPTFVGMSTLFIAVALLASWLPARRAAVLDPMTALRSE
jgi:predicted permease